MVTTNQYRWHSGNQRHSANASADHRYSIPCSVQWWTRLDFVFFRTLHPSIWLCSLCHQCRPSVLGKWSRSVRWSIVEQGTSSSVYFSFVFTNGGRKCWSFWIKLISAARRPTRRRFLSIFGAMLVKCSVMPPYRSFPSVHWNRSESINCKRISAQNWTTKANWNWNWKTLWASPNVSSTSTPVSFRNESRFFSKMNKWISRTPTWNRRALRFPSGSDRSPRSDQRLSSTDVRWFQVSNG